MNIALCIFGLATVMITIYDMINTILAPRGAGLIADRVSRGIWRLFLFLTHKNGKRKLLRSVGPFMLLIIVLTWIVLLWLGNTLIVYSDPEALWSPDKNRFVGGFVENMYFIAYVLSSMGSGDFTPSSDWWMFYTGLISYTGVVFISLGISFLIPVIEATALKRQVSLRIHSLGKCPEEILTRFAPDNYEGLFGVLDDLQPAILKLAQYHLAYPIIHYFHSVHRFESLPVKLATLDEAMSIMLYKVPKKGISNAPALERTYEAMTYYLSTLASAFIRPSDDEPEHPETPYLEQISEESSIRGKNQGEGLVKRRKLLLAYLQNDGWNWKDVAQGKDRIELDS